MLASVDERTREIGLKKALGGSDLFVMVEFIMEALVICVFGGIVGVAVGFLVCVGLKITMDLDVDMALLAISSGGGLAAAMAIGLLSGAYPAAKASRMNPARAMRFE
jgi:putative ABC transport system permease protein